MQRIYVLNLHVPPRFGVELHNVISYENIWPGKYSKNISLADFQKPQFKNVIDFCFIILDICSLW